MNKITSSDNSESAASSSSGHSSRPSSATLSIFIDLTNSWTSSMYCTRTSDFTRFDRDSLKEIALTEYKAMQQVLAKFSMRYELLIECKKTLTRWPKELVDQFFGTINFDISRIQEKDFEAFTSLLAQTAIKADLGTPVERKLLLQSFERYSKAKLDLKRSSA
jgi:hypothetical protein